MKNTLLYAPFIVLVLLFPINFGGHLFIYPRLGIDENTGINISFILITLGLFLGLIRSFFNQQMAWYWRLLVVLSYVPALIASLIMSGM